MKFGFCGISYKNADLDIRDKIVFTDSKKLDCLQKMSQSGMEQCMVLFTCNRSELYYFFERESDRLRVKEIYQELFPEIDVSELLMEYQEKDALNYLFRVTAGLESQVLGEDQILGQVQDAVSFSRTMGYSGKELNKVVRDAVTCAKKIKSELKISQIPLSVSYVGIKELEKVCGICGRRVLIIGSGQTAALALRYVYAAQAAEITICNRTIAHAKKLKTEFPEIKIGEFEERYRLMKQCDIVISATSSPHLVIRANRCHFHQKVVLLDLASPRDIDKELAQERNCTLIDLGCLEKKAETNQKNREMLAEEGMEFIKKSVEETMGWISSTGVDTTIASLQQKCAEIVEDGFSYLNGRLKLSEREQKLLKRTLSASMKRFLREPVLELKKLDSEEEQKQYKEMVERLFQIGMDAEKKE